MHTRKFGKFDWNLSVIGYGMWGMAGWTGSDDKASNQALDKAVELGCNFFDTAWGYGAGKSEQILGNLLKRHTASKLYIATKIPPKEDIWPPRKDAGLQDIYPKQHITEFTEKSLKNLSVECIDLLQFHVWEDSWANQDEWQNEVLRLKQSGKVKAFGISTNRWEPENCIEALKTGLIDSVQTIYNIFDQSPEDKLLPYCQENGIAVIARVPFDEGSLTGKLNSDSRWPEGDFRNIYFCQENLQPTLERVEQLRQVVPEEMTMAEMTLRFIISNPAVTTVIPGMRSQVNVEANMAVGNTQGLDSDLITQLRDHRWDRVPTSWSC
ncbi:aldo/keto reductase [Teredinibacter sp. KSP-S5-2]|uniref:aldo/keto reductase n=1 Tax=Teredinibacter sp. KSP-S5-2 TaxID=3034506 RepID=UPI002935261B|nr:aldo/keto reductase [Teredinibacter sp. KSP-S5-2]WNO10674.1 aldo/keto reductase [Teredinibacter sp. KSP-S5-2]